MVVVPCLWSLCFYYSAPLGRPCRALLALLCSASPALTHLGRRRRRTCPVLLCSATPSCIQVVSLTSPIPASRWSSGRVADQCYIAPRTPCTAQSPSQAIVVFNSMYACFKNLRVCDIRQVSFWSRSETGGRVFVVCGLLFSFCLYSFAAFVCSAC